MSPFSCQVKFEPTPKPPRSRPGPKPKKDQLIHKMPADTNKTGVMRAFGITRGRLTDFRLIGFPVNEDGTYPVAKCIKWYKAESTIGAGKSNVQLDANERVVIAKAEKIERENIVIVAAPAKLDRTPVLRFDTGDAELDERLVGDGFLPVVTGYHVRRLVEARC